MSNTPKYNKTPKSDMELAYDDAKDLARAEVRRLTRRITDRLYVAIDREFADALSRGDRIEVRPEMSDIVEAAREDIELLLEQRV